MRPPGHGTEGKAMRRAHRLHLALVVVLAAEAGESEVNGGGYKESGERKKGDGDGE